MKKLNSRNKFRTDPGMIKMYCLFVEDRIIWIDPREKKVCRDSLTSYDEDLRTAGRVVIGKRWEWLLLAEDRFWEKVAEEGIDPLIAPVDI